MFARRNEDAWFREVKGKVLKVNIYIHREISVYTLSVKTAICCLAECIKKTVLAHTV